MIQEDVGKVNKAVCGKFRKKMMNCIISRVLNLVLRGISLNLIYIFHLKVNLEESIELKLRWCNSVRM